MLLSFVFKIFAVSSECLSEPSLPSSGRPRYSSTSSLSSAATASSPCAAGIPVSHKIQFAYYCKIIIIVFLIDSIGIDHIICDTTTEFTEFTTTSTFVKSNNDNNHTNINAFIGGDHNNGCIAINH